jgi:Porin subfamily
MNIKSLLIGSAAALVAVSGARAADAVVAEPEAVEYVRVCDAYGAGFFYIPGTETCLKIGGYVRYDIGFGESNGLDTLRDGIADGRGDAFDKLARFSFQTNTAAETDYGTLKTYTEVRFNYGQKGAVGLVDARQNGTQVSLNFAYIELGGLRIGKDESAYTTFAGYAGNVINDGIVGYGPFDTTLISYTFTSGSFSGIVSLEDDNGRGKGYIPNVVVGAKYSAGDFAVTGVLGYDESSKGLAGKVRLDGKVGAFSGFVMAGYGNKKGGVYHAWNGSWGLWAGASYDFSEKATFNMEVDYDKAKNFAVVANVKYTVAPGFAITPEAVYKKAPGSKAAFGGVLRFQRSF